jgi:hypothetical protein
MKTPHRAVPAIVAGEMVIATMWAAVIGFVTQLNGPVYDKHLYSAMMVGCVVGVAGPILLIVLRACVSSLAAAVVFVTFWVVGAGAFGYWTAYYWYGQGFGC